MIRQPNSSTGLSSTVLALLILLATRPVVGQPPLAYDGFSYASPGPLFGADGGSGFAFAWQTNPADYSSIGDGSLPFDELMMTGNRVTAVSRSAATGSAFRQFSVPIGDAGTTRYLCFLVRPEGTLHEGLFNGYFGVQVGTSGTHPSLFVGKPGGGAMDEFVLENLGGTGQVSSGVTAVVGEEYLLVLRADFTAGNDAFTLYVNPVPGEPEPPANTVKNDSDVGLVLGLFIVSTGAFSIDEIRLGESYQAVTPLFTVPGDVNNNGVTDINDYIIIRNNFLGTNKTRAQGDLSGDGAVNFTDFRLWKNNRTAGSGADIDVSALLRELSQTVPEPNGVALMAAGAIIGLTTRRFARVTTMKRNYHGPQERI